MQGNVAEQLEAEAIEAGKPIEAAEQTKQAETAEAAETFAGRAEPGRLCGYIKVIAKREDGRKKSFGFVYADDGREYFIHISNVSPREDFQEAMWVEFTPAPPVKPGSKHHMAIRVKTLGFARKVE